LEVDRVKWDKRYSVGHEDFDSPDEFLVEHAGILGSGRALDVAAGLGANSVFLARHGHVVDALDISFVALSRLKTESRERGLNIQCIVADLDHFFFPNAYYDLAIVFYFFSAPLIEQIKACLRQQGLIVYATFNIRHVSLRPEFNPAYLIRPDSLAGYFADFQILRHETEAGEAHNISRLVARKTTASQP
jgi:tellurite methyltransferase